MRRGEREVRGRVGRNGERLKGIYMPPPESLYLVYNKFPKVRSGFTLNNRSNPKTARGHLHLKLRQRSALRSSQAQLKLPQ